ncbi:11297_t:CDS:2, partial [Ambispora leptoticha]
MSSYIPPFIVPDCSQQVSGRVADNEVIVPTSEQVLERLAHGKLIVPNCSEQLFKEIAHANPHLRMNLIEGQLELIPVLKETNKKCLDAKEFDIIGQLYVWCRANRNLVGQGGASQGAFRVPNGRGGFNILGPDASVVLSPRWNAFLANQPSKRPGEPNYPEVTPNFIIEIRSESDTALDVDRKMNLWMRGGAEGRISIDPFTNIIRVYTLDVNTNTIIYREILNCTSATQIPSQLLPGFVL